MNMKVFRLFIATGNRKKHYDHRYMLGLGYNCEF